MPQHQLLIRAVVRHLTGVIKAALLYAQPGYATFHMPTDPGGVEACGFFAEDFITQGRIAYPPVRAWWISFLRRGEHWTALAVGLAVAFELGRRRPKAA